MADTERVRVASFQVNRVRAARGGAMIEKISWFEQQKPDNPATSGRSEDAHAQAAIRMQSSACFDAWALPDAAGFDPAGR